MKAIHSHSSVSDCQDNHLNQYYEPSIDAYFCPSCLSEVPLLKDFDILEEDDEYALHIGI